MSIVYKSRVEKVDTGYRVDYISDKFYIEKNNDKSEIKFSCEEWDYDTYEVLNREVDSRSVYLFPRYIGFGGFWFLYSKEIDEYDD